MTMHATIDRHGNVTITYNMQSDRIEAPASDAQSAIYLPCDGECGRLMTVAPNVVSARCDECVGALERGDECEACGRARPVRFFDGRELCHECEVATRDAVSEAGGAA